MGFRRVASLALLLLPILAADTPAQRSFVGKRLPRVDYVDTEGRIVRPHDYEGSVLVVFGGIPW
jgi:hypothetical protein